MVHKFLLHKHTNQMFI